MNTQVDLYPMDRWIIFLILTVMFISVAFSGISCTENIQTSLNKLQEDCSKKGGRLIAVEYEGYVCVKEFSL